MANIVFRPTCSRCLEILDDCIIDYQERIVRCGIQPYQCPYCGEVFKTIVMPRAGLFPISDKELMEDSERLDI